ncbi:MAG: magnesium-translocating P-type ATPase [Patescibacteria group bacterium]|jgi:Mg2+-importing ATPase
MRKTIRRLTGRIKNRLQAGKSEPAVFILGLSSAEAARRLGEFGANTIARTKRLHPVMALLKKFTSPLLLVLTVASLVSFFAGERVNALIILAMIFISGIMDFVNTYRSEQVADRLIERVRVTATALRDGREQEVGLESLVPGDVVVLSAGDVIPADCAVIEARDFFVDQAALTGESFPVEKRAVDGLQAAEAEAISADNVRIVCMGTNVITGYAKAVVRQTGARTEIGGIAERLSEAGQETDFDRGIRRFSYFIMRITFVLVSFVFLANMLMDRPVLDAFIFAVAIAVGLVPELLPVIMTVALSRGSLRMSERRVVVKKLPAIQNFGSMDVLCTDKTGTLTEGRIVLVECVDTERRESAETLLGAYLNSAFHTGIANPLDKAIIEFKSLDITAYRKIDEVPFDFDRRRQSVIVENAGGRTLFAKGAPESVFEVCASYRSTSGDRLFDAVAREAANAAFQRLGEDGFRVIAVASRSVGNDCEVYSKTDEQDLTLLGFAAFLDPPKAGVSMTIDDLCRLGVDIKILTGDNEILTTRICRDIGLKITGVATGADLDKLTDADLGKLVVTANIFARISPQQKERVIRAIQKSGLVVGYLGDGINDTPALKAADVGISVNNAVDVAKETADIILLDKSLSVLRDGIIEGRKTFRNTLKYITMGLSSNFGNMFSMAGMSVILPFLPMLPKQVLFNNFLYDTSQLSLPGDTVDDDEIEKPQSWDFPFLRRYMMVFGLLSSVFDFATCFVLYYFFHLSEHQFQAGWFMESLATQVFVVYIIRTRKVPFLQSSPSRSLLATTLAAVIVGWLMPAFILSRELFDFTPLPWPALVAIVAIVLVYLGLAEAVKRMFFRRMYSGKTQPASKPC